MRIKLALSIVITRLLDMLTTHYHVSRYGYYVEGNPITRSIMAYSYPAYLISNMFIALVIALAVYKFVDNFVVRGVGIGLVVISLVAVTINTTLML